MTRDRDRDREREREAGGGIIVRKTFTGAGKRVHKIKMNRVVVQKAESLLGDNSSKPR